MAEGQIDLHYNLFKNIHILQLSYLFGPLFMSWYVNISDYIASSERLLTLLRFYEILTYN